MANFKLAEKGEKVKLIGMTAVKLKNSYGEIRGYVTKGEIEEVTIEGFIGEAIISNSRLYPLTAEFDCDFYVVVYEEK